MQVLLIGASGFLGSAIGEGLLSDGHVLRAAGRDLALGRRILPAAQWIHCDLRQIRSADDWNPLLRDIDFVVNASGALQDGLRDNLTQVQELAIGALAESCAAGNVAHLVHVSAAGAVLQDSDFMQTKARADAAVAAAAVSHTILRPGLVIGRNAFGGSELLRAVAALPLIRVEVAGGGPIQCVALADVVAAVRRALASPADCAGAFDLVEREHRSLGEVIACHRRWLGFAPPRFTLRVSLALLRPAALLADALGWLGWRSPLRSNAVAALAHGVRGDASQAVGLLGREPLSLADIFAGLGPSGKADRRHSRLTALYPLALASLLLLWLAGGLVGLARIDAAAELLVDGGLPVAPARGLVLLGSLVDLLIAAGILFRPALRLALGGGALLALGYALGAVLIRPDLWLDPLGAMFKTIPIIVLSLVCLAMSEER